MEIDSSFIRFCLLINPVQVGYPNRHEPLPNNMCGCVVPSDIIWPPVIPISQAEPDCIFGHHIVVIYRNLEKSQNIGPDITPNTPEGDESLDSFRTLDYYKANESLREDNWITQLVCDHEFKIFVCLGGEDQVSSDGTWSDHLAFNCTEAVEQVLVSYFLVSSNLPCFYNQFIILVWAINSS